MNLQDRIEDWFYKYATKEPDGTFTLVLHENHGWPGAAKAILALVESEGKKIEWDGKAKDCTGNPCEDCREPYDVCSCSCHTAPTTGGWEERFDAQFLSRNTPSGVAKSYTTSNLKQYTLDIKDFIRQTIKNREREIADWAQEEKYADDHEDLGAEAIADHAYKDKFDAFMGGYNTACDEFIKKINTPNT